MAEREATHNEWRLLAISDTRRASPTALSAGSLTRDTLQFDMDTDVDVMSMTNAREKQTSR